MPEAFPVKKDQLIEVRTYPNKKGPDPIAWVDGLAVFVQGADPYTDIVARVVHCGDNFAIAEKVTEAEAQHG